MMDGRLRALKVPSTPADPTRAVIDALTRAGSLSSAEVRHGTTVGTNTLLERKGARVAFITTQGFEDTLSIGRQNRPKLYDLFVRKEPPLTTEELCFGVAERVASDGTVLQPVCAADLARLKQAVRDAQPESIAVSLLFAFANPANEQAVAAALADIGVPLSSSHEILPEFREYERASAVVINAYLAPRMQGYLDRLNTALGSRNSRLLVMQSSGGIVPAAIAAREPVRTILSGPAGGVVGAIAAAREAGFLNIITFDMGGTSTDVALVNAGKLPVTVESQIAGMPVAVPSLKIHTVGAGGGSIAAFDRGGVLGVGPQSAGADPGPICYGRGEQPTVTDANLILGRFGTDALLGGEMPLDRERAGQHLDREKKMLPSAEDFARGIVRVANSHMEKALRTISVEQGYDPRDFTLVSFGGAGPLHACDLARALRIPRVLVPRLPGALSAYGILVSDIIRDFSRTVMLSPGDPEIENHFAALEEMGGRFMGGESLKPVAMRSLDLRYAGQGYELSVDWSRDFVNDFHRTHERLYGYSDAARPVTVVNVRVRMIAVSEKPAAHRDEVRPGSGKQALIGEGVYDRARLHAGDSIAGPAVITEYSATTFLPSRAVAQVDALGNLVIEVET